MRAGLIGAGAMAQHHLGILANRDVEVAAVCDMSEARAQAAAGPAGAAAYSDAAAMFAAERLDAVFVCTPPEAHVDPTADALARGIAVYLEKPLARTVADGEAIVAAWEAGEAVCAVGYQWRSLDVLAAVRAALGETPPGLLVSRSFGGTEGGRNDLDNAPGSSWFLDPRRSGGILFELGSHDVDLQRALAGPVESVQATAGSGRLALSGVEDTGGLDDAVTVLMRFANGGLGAVLVGWSDAQDPPVYSLDVQAAGVALELELDPVWRVRGRAGGHDVDVQGAANPRESTVDRFLEAVAAGDRGLVPCSPADALGTLRTLLACERSIATGERVPVNA